MGQGAPPADAAGRAAGYAFADPPLAGPTPVVLGRGADGRPEVAVTVPSEDPGGLGTETYVFALLAPSAAATPAP